MKCGSQVSERHQAKTFLTALRLGQPLSALTLFTHHHNIVPQKGQLCHGNPSPSQVNPILLSSRVAIATIQGG